METQTIGDVMVRMNAQQMTETARSQHTSCHPSQTAETGTVESAILSRMSQEAVKLYNDYHPSKQTAYSSYPQRCVGGKAPTLAAVRERYGNVITENWLIIQINDFNSYIGVKEQSKNTVFQMAEMAKMICSRYFYLKLSEIMLFFFKLKVGDYGKMYGYVDPMAIMEGLRYFLRYRAEILDEMDREQRHKEQELWKKTAINREQWEEIKKARAIMGNNAPNLSPNAIKQLAR